MTICKLSNNTCISWLQKSALRVSLLITPPWSQQNQAATKYWKYRARCKLQVCDCSVHVQEKQKTTHRTFRWILSEFRIHLQMFVVCYFFLCTLSTCDITFFFVSYSQFSSHYMQCVVFPSKLIVHYFLQYIYVCASRVLQWWQRSNDKFFLLVDTFSRELIAASHCRIIHVCDEKSGKFCIVTWWVHI